MKKYIIVMLLLIVSACATSSGVVSIGKDTYLVSKQGAAYASVGVLRAELYQEASAFCAKQGKQLMPVSSTGHPQGWQNYAEAELQFMCLQEGDRELGRPKMAPAPDIVIEDRKK